jgi:SnoaL-like domain
VTAMTSTSTDPSSDQADLETKVAVLAAAEAARTLIHDYALACDEHDVAAVAALFEPDAELWAGPRQLRGRDEIRAFYAGAFDRPRRHIVGVAALVPDGASSLTAHASFVAIETTAGGTGLTWGSYADRIVVSGDRARFASRRITIDGSTTP